MTMKQLSDVSLGRMRDQIPFPLESITLEISKEASAEDIARVLPLLKVVLKAGSLEISINGDELYSGAIIVRPHPPALDCWSTCGSVSCGQPSLSVETDTILKKLSLIYSFA